MTVPEAAGALGITGKASMNAIRARYRVLAKEWHPDVSDQKPDVAHEMFIRIREAYNILEDYCLNYEISFQPEDIRTGTDYDSRKFWMDRFGDDPIWGRNKPH